MAPSSFTRLMNSQSTLRLMLASASLLIMIYVTTDSSLRVSTPKFLRCPSKEQVCGSGWPAAITSDEPSGELAGFSVDQWVVGPPAKTLQENLKNDTQYVTAFLDAGWTNGVMTQMHLIYLGMISSRVPILPPFSPMHIGFDSEDFPFGDVFDLPRLRGALGYPILEWRNIKNPKSEVKDVLGCWSASSTEDGKPRISRLHWTILMDISYTNVPRRASIGNRHNSYWELARLGFAEGYQEGLREAQPMPSEDRGLEIPPSTHVLCFNDLYYVGAADPYEWEKEHSPAWRFVGRHARFHPKMIELADQYLRKAFGLANGETIPPFISMHVRHGDFKESCGNSPKEYCLAPVSVLAKKVEEVRASLLSQLGITIGGPHVLVTSDEQDPSWWAQIDRLGWSYINHASERTAERYGKWYPTFIDAVHQSMGMGFIGTHDSTMSLLALRRVTEWNGGLGLMIPWGPNEYAPKRSK